MARSIARAVRGASGMVTILPPLRRTVRVRCPRSRPRASMSAPRASEIRSPLIASSEIRACSFGCAEPGGDEQRADFVAVQADGVGLVVQPRPSDVDGG